MAIRTLLLTDVVDSTGLGEQLGDAAMAALWARHDRVARDLLVAHGGREIDKTDGFLLIFDEVAQGLAYANAYHAAIGALGLQARAGLHVGDVILTENRPSDVARGAKPVEVDGSAKPYAARVMALAIGGQTLATAEAIHALGGGGVSHGHWLLKGLSRPVELFEVGEPERAPFTPPPDAPKAWRVVLQDGVWVPVKEIRRSLPAERDTFVGREADLQALAARLDGARLVTVLGTGGTGKTRLVTRFAWAWLGDYPGGAWFCDLADARDVEGIVRAVARTLDVALGKDDPVTQLGHVIASRGRCLVVLDNFEQVARHAGATLGRWLDRAADAHFLVTAREVLGLHGEAVFALSPLDAEDGVRLFEARARAAKHDVVLDDEASLRHLVARLDGLPLAIELAAARVRLMAPRQILDRLSERFKLLASTGARHTRQATLRATLDWSWDLLAPDEQQALAQLSVFEGGFTLEAAEAVLQLQDMWATDAVQALIDKSLVRQVADARFGLLVSVQEYAAERLAAGTADVAARHGRFFADLGAPEAIAALFVHGGVDRRRRLAIELDNLVVACRRAIARDDPGVAAGALAAACEVIELRGPFKLGMALAEGVLSLDAANYVARVCHARTLLSLGRAAEARAGFEAVLTDAPPRAEARLRSRIGRACVDLGQVTHARAEFEAALARSRALGDRGAEGDALSGLGSALRRLGEVQAARVAFDAALVALREVGDRVAEGAALANSAVFSVEQGREEEARVRFEASLVIHREVGNRRSEGIVLGNIGVTYATQGRPDDAYPNYVAALARHREVGDRSAEVTTLSNIGSVYLIWGKLDASEEHFRASLTIAQELGYRGISGTIHRRLGDLHLERMDLSAARASYAEGESLLREVGDSHQLAFVVCGQALVAAHDGDRSAALAALAEAEGLAARTSAGPESELGRRVATVRAFVAG